MKTKKSKPVIPPTEIINAVLGDVALNYAYDMPNGVEFFFKRDDGEYDQVVGYFVTFYYGFNEHDNNRKLNFGETMSRFMEVFAREFDLKFSKVIGTPMRLKITRGKLADGTERIKVVSIGHITRNLWLP